MTDQPAIHEQPGAVPQEKDRVLRLIGALRLLEGLLVLAMAVGALKLLHHDLAALVADWIAAIRIDPHNEFIHALLENLGFLDDRRLKEISAGSFVYASLKLTEAGGLLWGKRWAEYFTAVTTGAFIPLEVYELIHRASWPKAVVLVVNVGIVWYLIVNLRRTRKQGPML
jgi:uncharacterized membrane protein (DUF2068 family)